nr:hypothetical protein CFP56_70730 [Quercus suber]
MILLLQPNLFSRPPITASAVSKLRTHQNSSKLQRISEFFPVTPALIDMDSMNEENDEYGDTVSSAPKRMRCRTSSVWSDFEILPIGSDGKERAKCKKCQNSFIAGSSGTTSLLRHFGS